MANGKRRTKDTSLESRRDKKVINKFCNYFMRLARIRQWVTIAISWVALAKTWVAIAMLPVPPARFAHSAHSACSARSARAHSICPT